MAWTSVGSIGGAQHTGSQNTVVMTTNATAVAGSVVVISVAINNTSTTDGNTTEVSSITDSVGGNTWTKAREFCNSQGAAAAGATVAMFFSILTNQIASGQTITANLANNINKKALAAWNFTVGSGNSAEVATAVDLPDDGGDFGSMTISSLNSQEYLFYRGSASETNTSFVLTPTTSYTAVPKQTTAGGSSPTNIACYGEWIIATGTGHTSNPSYGLNHDQAHVFVAFREVAGSPDVTEALTGVASTLAVGNVLAANEQEITGNASTGEIGNVVHGEGYGLTSVSSTGEAGSLDNSRTIPLTGIFTVADVGTIVAHSAFALTGTESTSAVGTVIAEINSNQSHPITGVESSDELGTVELSNDLSLTGNEPIGQIGSISSQSSASLSGTSTTGEVGSLVLDTTLDLNSVSASSEVGTVSYGSDVLVNLTGVESVGEIGTLNLLSSFTQSGNSSAGEVGTLIVSKNVSLTGNESEGLVGTITPTTSANVNVNLSGNESITTVGSVTQSGTDSIPIHGGGNSSPTGRIKKRPPISKDESYLKRISEDETELREELYQASPNILRKDALAFEIAVLELKLALKFAIETMQSETAFFNAKTREKLIVASIVAQHVAKIRTKHREEDDLMIFLASEMF